MKLGRIALILAGATALEFLFGGSPYRGAWPVDWLLVATAIVARSGGFGRTVLTGAAAGLLEDALTDGGVVRGADRDPDRIEVPWDEVPGNPRQAGIPDQLLHFTRQAGRDDAHPRGAFQQRPRLRRRHRPSSDHERLPPFDLQLRRIGSHVRMRMKKPASGYDRWRA